MIRVGDCSCPDQSIPLSLIHHTILTLCGMLCMILFDDLHVLHLILKCECHSMMVDFTYIGSSNKTKTDVENEDESTARPTEIPHDKE